MGSWDTRNSRSNAGIRATGYRPKYPASGEGGGGEGDGDGGGGEVYTVGLLWGRRQIVYGSVRYEECNIV